MHMPGHKRNPLCTMPDPYSLDVTEVPGVDDLHHPVEMIRDLMDELTKYYDSKQTYLLVNGSTCGILAAITACCYPGDKILVARNCHKSVYNAIKLLGLRRFMWFRIGWKGCWENWELRVRSKPQRFAAG